MKRAKKLYILLFSFIFITLNINAFENGWVLNMRANVGGSLTTPFISPDDLATLGANKMDGMVGFIGGGSAEIGKIFDNETYFNLPKEHWFSGLGLFGRIGVTQGYSGQISGTEVKLNGQNPKQVDVFVNVYFTPVLTFGAATKAYFLKNRLALGFGLGGKLIADTSPTYEIYSTEPETISPEVGTIIVDDWMMKNMNPLQITTELFAEYNVKILPTTELILGGYVGYNFYRPKYVTMPDSVLNMAIKNSGFDPHKELSSYYLNSFDFGLTFALGFRLD